jgi:hypothetical protein
LEEDEGQTADMATLPELTTEGELPPGVHVTDWREFHSWFCAAGCGFPQPAKAGQHAVQIRYTIYTHVSGKI